MNDADKPRLRGVSHQAAFFAALGAGLVLVSAASSLPATIALGVYVSSLTLMFGVSALYHRPRWSPPARRLMRRLDHSAIWFLIAGTYTPICVLTLGAGSGTRLLLLAWIAACGGVAKTLLWTNAPKWVTAGLYLALGWAFVPYFPEVMAALGTIDLSLIAAGGLLYTIGAFVYALRAPDPIPAVFGYHEIFHALVIAASACHFVAISRVALSVPTI